jgi:PIN domain nuclease of toxin-antitoxin system
MAAGQLPRHHVDPFDRMLIAQAFAEGLTVVTHDKRFTAYDVPTLAV